MRLVYQGFVLLFVTLLMQACVSNQKSVNGQAIARDVNATAYSNPSIENNSYMYRSPPAGALQSRGLAR